MYSRHKIITAQRRATSKRGTIWCHIGKCSCARLLLWTRDLYSVICCLANALILSNDWAKIRCGFISSSPTHLLVTLSLCLSLCPLPHFLISFFCSRSTVSRHVIEPNQDRTWKEYLELSLWYFKCHFSHFLPIPFFPLFSLPHTTHPLFLFL